MPRRVQGVSDTKDLQRGERGESGVCDIFTVSSFVKQAGVGVLSLIVHVEKAPLHPC